VLIGVPKLRRYEGALALYNRFVRTPETVRTARLTGRRFTETDYPYVCEIDSDLRVQQGFDGMLQTEEQSQERLQRWIRTWEEHGFGYFLFTDDQSKIVGHGGVFPSPRVPSEVELGYVVKPSFWRKGFATEIARAALCVGFEDLRFERIIAIALASNAGSRRVMERCGMTFEADTTLFAPSVPTVRYGLSRAEWFRSSVGLPEAK